MNWQVRVAYIAVFQWKTSLASLQFSLKADERSLWCKRCMCMCQTQTESQSWVCMAVGEAVVGFHSGVGCADRCWDGLWFPVSSTSNLPCDTTATRRPCIVPSVCWELEFQLFKGLFDTFIKWMVLNWWFLNEMLRRWWHYIAHTRCIMKLKLTFLQT